MRLDQRKFYLAGEEGQQQSDDIVSDDIVDALVPNCH
jgi:hypothetical protein